MECSSAIRTGERKAGVNMLPTRIASMTLSMTGLRISAARSSTVAIGLVMMISLSGCAVGPRYHRLSAPVPPQFNEAVPTQASATTPIAYNDWWRVFDDPVLGQLENEADSANQDIRVAVARVDQAEAAARYSRSFLSPTISLGTSASRSREAQNRAEQRQHQRPGVNLQRFPDTYIFELRNRRV